MQDRIGAGYALLKLGKSKEDLSPMEAAFKSLGAPFEVEDLPDERARELYGYDLILLRPDLHVAWRGQRAPAQPRALAALVTGQRAATE